MLHYTRLGLKEVDAAVQGGDLCAERLHLRITDGRLPAGPILYFTVKNIVNSSAVLYRTVVFYDTVLHYRVVLI